MSPLGLEAERSGAWASRFQYWSNKSAPEGITMTTAKNLVARLVKDEQGGEVLEYALIAGLIVVACIAIIGSVGNKVLARWTSLNGSM
jgi:pilus assembly protein Flp/PilA